MLQHLSSLRASVAGLCPVYHPWVRHMANQDRWVIRVNDEGNPESVVLVPAVDAKLLVTIAKDNHNSFPDFKGHSLPLKFAKKLLDIYTDGPMARLLSSVVKIKDQDSWWADAERLIQHAAVEDKYKDIQTFALDVAEGDSAIQQSMRNPLSDALFAWETTDGTEEYETETAPRPKLGVIGLSYLFSRNEDIPSFTRYGMNGLASYPVHKHTVREMAACLEWITREERRGRTWQAVPGKDKD